MSTTQYEQPIVSIDVVPIAFRADDKPGALRELQILRGHRLFEPFAGDIALPGVMVGMEHLEAAAYRALASKVGVDRSRVAQLVKLGAFDTSDRDPRGPTISIAYIALVDPYFDADPQRARWEPFDGPDWVASPFDHDVIIRAALQELSFRLWNDRELTYTLLDHQFTTGEALDLHRVLRGEQADTANFTRMIKGLPGVEAVGKTSGGRGRPSTIWSAY